VRGPGPLRAFYERVAWRRGNHIAAVAVARKLAVIIWHMLTKDEDYAGVRPALHAKKLRDLELRQWGPHRRDDGVRYLNVHGILFLVNYPPPLEPNLLRSVSAKSARSLSNLAFTSGGRYRAVALFARPDERGPRLAAANRHRLSPVDNAESHRLTPIFHRFPPVDKPASLWAADVSYP
jgi:hypothetical protein